MRGSAVRIRPPAPELPASNRPGLYGDGNTLYPNVAPGGSKQWIQRLTINGKRHDIGLGGCGWVTLAQAREAAHENRMLAYLPFNAMGRPGRWLRRALAWPLAERS